MDEHVSQELEHLLKQEELGKIEDDADTARLCEFLLEKHGGFWALDNADKDWAWEVFHDLLRDFHAVASRRNPLAVFARPRASCCDCPCHED